MPKKLFILKGVILSIRRTCPLRAIGVQSGQSQEKIMKLRSGACMPNIKKSDLGNFELIISTDVNIQNQTVLILENISAKYI